MKRSNRPAHTDRPRYARRRFVCLGLRVCWILLTAAGLGCGSSKEQPPPDGRKSVSTATLAADPRLQSHCATPEQNPPPPSRRVVLVVIDALRADGLGLYGYDRPTSPKLDRLANESIVFERFYAASPWTAPSFGTILTGVSPSIHKIGWRLYNKASERREGSPDTMRVGGIHITNLRSTIKTLPELLGAVPTAAIVNNAFLHPDVGLTRHFDHYDLVIPYGKKKGFARPDGVRDARETTDASIAWLEDHREGDFFIMIHYFDPHVAYAPPERYREIFTPNPTKRFATKFTDTRRARNGELKLSSRERQQIRGLYDGEVRYVDDQIAALVDAMRRLDMLDDTWLIVTADHGEEHFDHGGFDHGHRYEDEVTRVPLIIRPPGGQWCAGSRVSASASHVDLMPSVLEWFGHARHPQLEGRPLQALITGDEKKHRPAFMEYNLFQGQQCALFDGRFKLVVNIKNGKRYMYDIALDPLEKKKLGKDHPRFKQLNEKLRDHRRQLERRADVIDSETEPRAGRAVELSEEVAESLRALGYVE